MKVKKEYSPKELTHILYEAPPCQHFAPRDAVIELRAAALAMLQAWNKSAGAGISVAEVAKVRQRLDAALRATSTHDQEIRTLKETRDTYQLRLVDKTKECDQMAQALWAIIGICDEVGEDLSAPLASIRRLAKKAV